MRAAVLCHVCQRAQSRYTCPRCEAPYCSLDCYRSHGGECTEHFFKAQVEEELRGQRASGEERRNLERIVSKLNNLGEPDPEEEGDASDDGGSDEEEARLEELAGRAQSGDLRVEDLTEKELQHFHAELRRGSIGRSLEQWEPWWQKAAVAELDSLDDDEPGSWSGPPRPHICCTSSRQASPCVAITVFEAVYAYVHTMRLFNGDTVWDPLQAASHFLHIARAVCSQKSYGKLGECVPAVLLAAAAFPGGGSGAMFDTCCLTDAVDLLDRRGGSPVRALLEAADVLSRAMASVEGRGDGSRAVGGLGRSVKKLEFLAAFAQHHEELLAPVAAEGRWAARRKLEALETRQESEACQVRDGVALPAREKAC